MHFRGQGRSRLLQDPFLMFRTKPFLFILCFLAPFKLLKVVCFLSLNPHVSFQNAFMPTFSLLSKGPFGALIGYIPHFQWRYKPHLNKNHCVGGFFGELGINNTNHCFQILIGFTSVLIGDNWGEQFGFTLLLGALEVVSRVSSFGCSNMSTFVQLAQKGAY